MLQADTSETSCYWTDDQPSVILGGDVPPHWRENLPMQQQVENIPAHWREDYEPWPEDVHGQTVVPPPMDVDLPQAKEVQQQEGLNATSVINRLIVLICSAIFLVVVIIIALCVSSCSRDDPHDASASASQGDSGSKSGESGTSAKVDFRCHYSFISHYAWNAIEQKTLDPEEFQRKAFKELMDDEKAGELNELLGKPGDNLTAQEFAERATLAFEKWSEYVADNRGEGLGIASTAANRLLATAILLPRIKSGLVKGLDWLFRVFSNVCLPATRELIFLADRTIEDDGEKAAYESLKAYEFLGLPDMTSKLWPHPGAPDVGDMVLIKSGLEGAYTSKEVEHISVQPDGELVYKLKQTVKTEITANNFGFLKGILLAAKLLIVGGERTEKRKADVIKTNDLSSRELTIFCGSIDQKIVSFTQGLSDQTWTKALGMLTKFGGTVGDLTEKFKNSDLVKQVMAQAKETAIGFVSKAADVATNAVDKTTHRKS